MESQQKPLLSHALKYMTNCTILVQPNTIRHGKDRTTELSIYSVGQKEDGRSGEEVGKDTLKIRSCEGI